MSRRGTVKRDAAGSWYFVVDIAAPGSLRRQVKRRGFHTKREAQARLTRLLGELERGTFVEPDTITLGEYLVVWCDALATSGRRLSTTASYRENLRHHVVPYVGCARLQALTASDLDRLYAQLLDAGRCDGRGGLSPRSVRYVHTIVRRALADATRKGLVQRNVADLATPPSARSARAREMPAWNPDELLAFLDSVADHRLFALFRVAGMTGLRRGELLGLRWSDLDFDAGRLSVRRQVITAGGKVRFGELKTDQARRSVGVDDKTLTVLAAHRARQIQERIALAAGWSDRQLMFSTVEGSPLHPDYVSKLFERLVVAAGLPRIRFHDLRHSHAAHQIAAGVHTKVVSDRLGHASASFTMDRYGHVLPNLQAEAARAVAALVDGELGELAERRRRRQSRPDQPVRSGHSIGRGGQSTSSATSSIARRRDPGGIG